MLSVDGGIDDDSIDVDLVLSKLYSCSKDAHFDISAFFAIRGMESDDLLLTCEDVVSHFLNGQCANRKAPGCSEVAQSVQSPIKMVLTVIEAIIAHCEHKQIAPEELRAFCSVIGVTTARLRAHTILTERSGSRCNALRPLLGCDGLEKVQLQPTESDSTVLMRSIGSYYDRTEVLFLHRCVVRIYT